MAAAANITVKMNDTTTDIVWTLINPGGADGTEALWRSETVAGPMSVRPTFVMSARNNAAKTARRMLATVLFPQIYTESTTGLVKVANRGILQVNGLIPLGMDATQLNEFISQSMNIFATSAVKTAFKTASVPN